MNVRITRVVDNEARSEARWKVTRPLISYHYIVGYANFPVTGKEAALWDVRKRIPMTMIGMVSEGLGSDCLVIHKAIW